MGLCLEAVETVVQPVYLLRYNGVLNCQNRLWKICQEMLTRPGALFVGYCGYLSLRAFSPPLNSSEGEEQHEREQENLTATWMSTFHKTNHGTSTKRLGKHVKSHPKRDYIVLGIAGIFTASEVNHNLSDCLYIPNNDFLCCFIWKTCI